MTDTDLPAVKHAHKWPRDAHDFYIEPHWTSHRLFDVEPFRGEVTDPAAGSGRIVQAAEAAGLRARGYDIVDRGPHLAGVQDFMAAGRSYVNIVTNPPFGIADEFVARAIELAAGKVAALLPLTWMSGSKRSRWLEQAGLARVWVLTPRPSMPPGIVVLNGLRPGQGTKDFGWFVFDQSWVGPPQLRWLHREAPGEK